MVLELAIKAIRTNVHGTTYNHLTQHMAYADDVVLTTRTKNTLAGSLQEFEEAAKKLGLLINAKKTVNMKTARDPSKEKNFIKFMNYNFVME
uniref:Reverse transcriptase domain-containing protein n=1 Tax=Rhodnius prolixus TaxID=13249 RepID=T1HC27_RHOPR